MSEAQWLVEFVRESNMIEGIHRPPTSHELEATKDFLSLPMLEVAHVKNLVSVYAPLAKFRDRAGRDVRVGNHIPPAGDPKMHGWLAEILGRANGGHSPWSVHLDYETLHPFTDGNGRSGRAIWAWQMLQTGHGVRLSFLHHFYYQTLQESRRHD